MVTIFTDDLSMYDSIAEPAVSIVDLLKLDHMDILIDVCHIENGWHGYCEVDEDDHDKADVFINESLDLHDQLIALSHELIHVCQFANRQVLEETEAYEYEAILLERVMGTS